MDARDARTIPPQGMSMSETHNGSREAQRWWQPPCRQQPAEGRWMLLLLAMWISIQPDWLNLSCSYFRSLGWGKYWFSRQPSLSQLWIQIITGVKVHVISRRPRSHGCTCWETCHLCKVYQLSVVYYTLFLCVQSVCMHICVCACLRARVCEGGGSVCIICLYAFLCLCSVVCMHRLCLFVWCLCVQSICV